jgi:hypothetical protein
MAKLVPLRQYRLAIPAGGGGGAVAPHRVTYLGREAGPSNRPCAVCGREDRGSHEFVEGDPDNPKWVWEIGAGCLRKCTITPEAATEERMGTMREVFGAIEEATFRGMGAITDTSAKARAAKDAERAAKRKGEHTWKDERKRGSDHGTQRLYNKYGDVVAEVIWFDIDEGRDKFAATVATPGVRGNPTEIGRFTSLDKAKAAVEKELGL